MRQVQLVDVSKGICEYCDYDYSSDGLKSGNFSWPVICPRCGMFSRNWDSDTVIEHEPYDYEKENYKQCPVCQRTIDYHTDGFISYDDLKVWVHRDHSVEETEKGLGRKLSDMEKLFITF